MDEQTVKTCRRHLNFDFQHWLYWLGMGRKNGSIEVINFYFKATVHCFPQSDM